jgi:hypothetical protein
MRNSPYPHGHAGIWSWQYPVLVDEARQDRVDALHEHSLR